MYFISQMGNGRTVVAPDGVPVCDAASPHFARLITAALNQMMGYEKDCPPTDM
jgi:hypothetical protein